MTENDTVVSARNDFRFLFESYLGIAPDTKIIAVINGNSPNEQFWQGELVRELKPLEDRIEIRWYDKLSYEDTLKQTASLPPHSAIFWYQMVVDAAGVAHEGDRALTRLYATANAPIFTHDDAFFGQEIIGGPMFSALDLSRKATAVAMRILGGEKAGDIKQPSTVLWHRNTIGASFDGGTSMRAVSPRTAKSTSASQRCGSTIGGKSR